MIEMRLENPGTGSSINKNTQEFLKDIENNIEQLDKIIEEKLIKREFSRLNDLTKQILRMGIFEIQKVDKSDQIEIDNLIQEYELLAREFLDENSPKLIKGILLQIN